MAWTNELIRPRLRVDLFFRVFEIAVGICLAVTPVDFAGFAGFVSQSGNSGYSESRTMAPITNHHGPDGMCSSRISPKNMRKEPALPQSQCQEPDSVV